MIWEGIGLFGFAIGAAVFGIGMAAKFGPALDAYNKDRRSRNLSELPPGIFKDREASQFLLFGNIDDVGAEASQAIKRYRGWFRLYAVYIVICVGFVIIGLVS